jgi:hypothetical protein
VVFQRARCLAQLCRVGRHRGHAGRPGARLTARGRRVLLGCPGGLCRVIDRCRLGVNDSRQCLSQRRPSHVHVCGEYPAAWRRPHVPQACVHDRCRSRLRP